jgi:hypothetical protein
MPTREDFEQALELAREAFRKRNPAHQAARAGVNWVPDAGAGSGRGRAEVLFLGTVYHVWAPDGEVEYGAAEGRTKDPALWEKIIVLHYFNQADGTVLAGRYISFKEIPDGRLYQPNFEKRAVQPLLAAFGADPGEALLCGQALGGKPVDLGDLAVTVPVFPRVPVTVVFWRADEEFPARVTLLFDRSIPHYLPTEDVVLASQMLAFRLVGLARERAASPPRGA